MFVPLITGIVLVALAAAAIIGDILGLVFALPGTLIGAAYLTAGSGAMSTYFTDFTGKLQSFVAYLVPADPLPVTALLRRVFPQLGEWIFSYVNSVESLILAEELGAGDALPFVMAILKSAVVYLAAAFWANAELMLVLLIIGVVFSVRRHSKKRRELREKAERAAQRAAEREAEEKARKTAQPEEKEKEGREAEDSPEDSGINAENNAAPVVGSPEDKSEGN